MDLRKTDLQEEVPMGCQNAIRFRIPYNHLPDDHIPNVLRQLPAAVNFSLGKLSMEHIARLLSRLLHLGAVHDLAEEFSVLFIDVHQLHSHSGTGKRSALDGEIT